MPYRYFMTENTSKREECGQNGYSWNDLIIIILDSNLINERSYKSKNINFGRELSGKEQFAHSIRG